MVEVRIRLPKLQHPLWAVQLTDLHIGHYRGEKHVQQIVNQVNSLHPDIVFYWIVYEVMGNHELGNPGSVYMHKDRGGKLVAGPCWDFDWGVLSYNTSPQARTGLINGSAIWYGRLRQDPAFEAKLKARFEELLPTLETIPDYMDACERLLTESARLNFAMWNPAQDASQNGGYIINGDENMTFESAVALLKSIYKERLKVIPTKL